MFTLSYMKTRHAAAWAQNYVEGLIAANNNPTPTDTWKQFTEKLDATFNDPNRQEKALCEFYEMKQGKKTAEEFFAEFDIVRAKAGLRETQHDVFLIERLKKALNIEVVRGVMRSTPVPVTYKDWRKKAAEVDMIEQQV